MYQGSFNSKVHHWNLYYMMARNMVHMHPVAHTIGTCVYFQCAFSHYLTDNESCNITANDFATLLSTNGIQ